MPSISNLPVVTQFTGTMIFPVVDIDATPDTTKKATFGQLRDYILLDVSVSSVAGKYGNVTLFWSDINGLATISTSGSYTHLTNVPRVFPVTTATNSVLGGVKVGSGINVTSDGTLSVTPYTLTSATSSALGGVKIGSGIAITGDGTISVGTFTLSTATSSAVGGVKIGAGISITGDGTISVASITETPNPFTILNTTSSTSTTTGALKVSGGIGVGGAIYASSIFSNNSAVVTTASISSYMNTFAAGTGTSVDVTDLAVTYWSNETLQTISDKGASTDNSVSITNSTSSTGTDTGALTVVGGVGIGGTVYVGEDLYAGTIYSNSFAVSTSSSLTVKSSGTTLASNVSSIDFQGSGVTATSVGTEITVTITGGGGGGTTFTGGTVTGATSFTNATASTSTNTGAVVVTGGLGVGGNINVANTVTAKSVNINGGTTPRVYSASNLNLEAVGRVQVTQSPFKVWNVTTSQRNGISASNGDLIYNTDTNKFQGYANGTWVDLN